MKKYLFILGIVFCANIFAASSDNHQVTTTVSAINELAITGGNVTLTVNTATAGSDPTNDTDTTASLSWTTNESSKKITVASSLVSPTYTTTAQSTSVTGGTAGSAITLNTTAGDFVTGISTTTGSCTIQYTAAATAAQGTGTDTHTTVTYTLTAV